MQPEARTLNQVGQLEQKLAEAEEQRVKAKEAAQALNPNPQASKTPDSNPKG